MPAVLIVKSKCSPPLSQNLQMSAREGGSMALLPPGIQGQDLTPVRSAGGRKRLLLLTWQRSGKNLMFSLQCQWKGIRSKLQLSRCDLAHPGYASRRSHPQLQIWGDFRRQNEVLRVSIFNPQMWILRHLLNSIGPWFSKLGAVSLLSGGDLELWMISRILPGCEEFPTSAQSLAHWAPLMAPGCAPNAPTEGKVQSGPKSTLSHRRGCNTEDTPSRAKEHLQMKQNTFLIT